ncbi:MAG: hypothetical protein ABJG47_13935 [Ekhidna sp.]
MTTSQPKSSLLISIGVFLIGILAADAWLFYELVQNPASYLWAKLILAPTLLVIGIVVAIKGYTSALRLTIGNDKLTYQYLMGSRKKHKITEITSWNEEIVKSKNGVYKRLSIQLKNGKLLRLSNHENSNYESVLNYLKKKVKVQNKRKNNANG